jgi:NAD(P)-dependent dehydrogenase (short-subunit alcohol dehydrogenase family)
MDITGSAFITGGASGIGKACCYAFAKERACGIVIADINLKDAEETVAAIKAVAVHPNFHAEAVHVDVSDLESVKRAIAHAAGVLNRIDYAVHSAGVSSLIDDFTLHFLLHSLFLPFLHNNKYQGADYVRLGPRCHVRSGRRG